MSVLTKATRAWLTRSFRPFHFTDTYENTLNYQNTKKLGLYVHIPFCRSLCDFCPYCKVKYNKSLSDAYIEALLKEIEMVGSTVGVNKKQVTSLYFGGGTPALLAHDIKQIIQQIDRYFVITEGIGIELHPRDVTEEKLTVLKAAGVTKISIGIQSFQPEYLNLLGRDEFDYSRMFKALAKVHFETVSMDFIFALPNQTIEILKEDIETAFDNGANHIAIYPFIDFTFTDRKFKKMTNKEKKKLLYEIVEHCQEKGYVRDSIWTFSKHGTSQYSSMTRENFLGFGCSATTLLEDQFKINTFDLDEYQKRINNGQLPTALKLKFSRRQRMVYYLFWTAYSMKVDPIDFQSFFGESLEHNYRFELWLARLLGFVKKENNQYVMTTKGSYYYHYYENFYTLSYIDSLWHLMKNESFPKELIIK
ncbi:coproporphyrinogen-III oxidase family protein [Neobacillus sp. LXY-4]|uniref:coproporphyrinogen-III oxidase family protein n=1 Tax=Neobacillus sp. LXY-4 TaxID=3379826 RepID=UPI003EE105F8